MKKIHRGHSSGLRVGAPSTLSARLKARFVRCGGIPPAASSRCRFIHNLISALSQHSRRTGSSFREVYEDNAVERSNK